MKLLPFLLFGLSLQPAAAAVLEDVGFARLRSELGARLPRVTDIVIMQVEGAVRVDHDGDPATRKIATWMPDQTALGLRGQSIVDKSGAPASITSAHATAVARRLIGTRSHHSMSSGAQALIVMAMSDWLSHGLLRSMSTAPPLPTDAIILNHSWASSLDTPARGGNNVRVLRRADWISDRDNVVQVAGIRNRVGIINQPLLSAAHNVIVVGRSDGQHSYGTYPLDSLYSGGRTRPHIVAPLKSSSAATPVVASAAALLIATASRSSLSTRQSVVRNRGGREIRDAARPETIRALLMATADRTTKNGQYPDIVDYRHNESDRSSNGLDSRFGAGQLNIFRAWHVLSAGEQERSVSADQQVALQGFDYVDDFSVATRTSRYNFSIKEAGTLGATLSWQVLFRGQNATRFDASAVLNNLDLCLFVINGQQEVLVESSASDSDTTETLYLSLEPGNYRLEVRFSAAQRPGATEQQDYALAWQFLPAGHRE